MIEGMTLRQGYRLVPVPESRRSELVEIDMWAFPTGVAQEEIEKLPLPLTWDRTSGVVLDQPAADAVPIDGAVPTDSPLVAIHSSYPFSRFPVPGATLPVSGLTWVGVHPGHRRRGILSAMIDQHFQDCLDRGEAVSALTAAEAAIYGRFGYGPATQSLSVTVPRGADLAPVAGSDALTVRIEKLDPAVHGELIAQVHLAAGEHPVPGAGLNRPGWVTRETPELRETFLQDAPHFRDGRETLRIVVVEADGEPRGYATFRRKVDWGHTGPRGTVSTGEIVALDPAATHRLWSTLLDVDLTHEVARSILPVDDAIMSLLVNPRAAEPRVADNVWVRLVDLPAALRGRQYAGDIDLVLHVTDSRLPANAGSWRVTARAFDADVSVERTEDAPDLTVATADLAAAYLGGTPLTAAAAAGRVEEHTDGALRQATTAFGWPVAPVCSWIF